jgi:hypothetical protein
LALSKGKHLIIIVIVKCTGEEEGDYSKKIEENRIKKRDKSSRPKKSGAERARQKKESIIDADQPGYLPYQSYTTQKSAYSVRRRGR